MIRVHLEEDAGKLLHDESGGGQASRVDDGDALGSVLGSSGRVEGRISPPRAHRTQESGREIMAGGGKPEAAVNAAAARAS